MKKSYLFALAVGAVMAGCSNNDLVNGTVDRGATQVPIEFNVQKQNITRGTNLESVKHYNFGVWAWKVSGKNSLADAEVMKHYLVGYGGPNVGYEHSGATTYATTPGEATDHKSPWFYEKLGTAEYTYEGAEGYYKKTDEAFMSANANQYLRYWDLAYEKTNFYCYAPYNKNVTFDKSANTMSFPDNVIRDGYEEPLNSDYANYSRTLGEFMYAGVQANNASLSDVTIPFKHMGAQLFIRFYEAIPGYKVEIIELNGDNGTIKSGVASGDIRTGIQATPATKGETGYSAGSYYTTSGATVTFTDAAVAAYSPSWGTGATTASTDQPLMFKIPQAGASTSDVAPANLTDFVGLNSTTHKVIPEASTSGTQTYSYSPTVYYPVAQPTGSTTGFTFHISYRIIAEDNKEVITVHNATVHVPYSGKASTSEDVAASDGQYITVWQPNIKYTYTFKFTKNTSGTTDPGTDIDPTDPTPSSTQALFPIVFDAATIEDFTESYSVYEILENEN